MTPRGARPRGERGAASHCFDNHGGGSDRLYYHQHSPALARDLGAPRTAPRRQSAAALLAPHTRAPHQHKARRGFAMGTHANIRPGAPLSGVRFQLGEGSWRLAAALVCTGTSPPPAFGGCTRRRATSVWELTAGARLRPAPSLGVGARGWFRFRVLSQPWLLNGLRAAQGPWRTVTGTILPCTLNRRLRRLPYVVGASIPAPCSLHAPALRTCETIPRRSPRGAPFS